MKINLKIEVDVKNITYTAEVGLLFCFYGGLIVSKTAYQLLLLVGLNMNLQEKKIEFIIWDWNGEIRQAKRPRLRLGLFA